MPVGEECPYAYKFGTDKEIEALLAQAEQEQLTGPKSLTPILPGMPARTARTMREPTMTPAQYEELRLQFLQHGQLLVQVTALALSDKPQQLSYAQTTLGLLVRLSSSVVGASG